MNEMIEKYLYDQPDSFYIGPNSKYLAQSVHGRGYVRYKKAKEQASLPPVDLETISKLVIGYLKSISIKTTDKPKIMTKDLDYLRIKEEFNLKDKGDIVWMKFTQDDYLGVVAAADDVNFNIPPNAVEYDAQVLCYDTFSKKHVWKYKYNTSGIIVHKLGKCWNEDFVLVFPLENIPDGYNRGDIEKAVGNYLIEKNVPILDFYSHIY